MPAWLLWDRIYSTGDPGESSFAAALVRAEAGADSRVPWSIPPEGRKGPMLARTWYVFGHSILRVLCYRRTTSRLINCQSDRTR